MSSDKGGVGKLLIFLRKGTQPYKINLRKTAMSSSQMELIDTEG